MKDVSISSFTPSLLITPLRKDIVVLEILQRREIKMVIGMKQLCYEETIT